jgi:hypothetical protein
MTDPFPWLTWIKSHLGEITKTGGTAPTAFVSEIFRHTNYGPLRGVTPASCAACLCAALEETGFSSPHSAAAISFVKYGSLCELQPGALCVFEWSPGEHHVSVCESLSPGDESTAFFLNANQGHRVQVSRYPVSSIIAIRFPVRA